MLPTEDPAPPPLVEDVAPSAPAPRVGRRTWAWGGFALVLALLVAYLMVPTARYGGKLSPPGPAAWDQPQPTRTAPPVAKPAPVPATPDNGTAATDEDSGTNAGANDATTGVDTETASTVPADEADMLQAIDRARFKALDRGEPRHWDGGGREGYVVPSAPVMDGDRECRNLVATVITGDGQPRSSTDRYCRADDDAEWVLG